jgi:sugar phosphate isomerase/epimerase
MFKTSILFGDGPQTNPASVAPGFELAEIPAGILVDPNLTDEEWEIRKQEIKSYKLPPIKIASHWTDKPSTTRNPDWEYLEFWTKRVLRRLGELGVECAGVWGYFFPKVEGYSPTRQMDGAIRYANLMGDVARKYNITMMMEPMAELNSLWPTYKEGLAFVRRVDHPNVKIMADLNYFLKLNQPFEHIKENPELCMHCHIAGEHGQPGVGNMREIHKAFFRVLRDVHYERAVSCACPWASTREGDFDFTYESAKSLAYVQELRAEVYNEKA